MEGDAIPSGSFDPLDGDAGLSDGTVQKSRRLDTRRPYERDVRRRPELDDLRAAAIKEFLREFDAYQVFLADDDRDPISLRLLIKPSALGAVRRLVRNELGADWAQYLPSDAELAAGAEVYDPRTFDDEPDADTPVISSAQLWDAMVRDALERAAAMYANAEAVSIEVVEARVRKALHWNNFNGSGLDAVNAFARDFERVNDVTGIRRQLPDGGTTGKRLVKLLTSCLRPEPWRAHIESRALKDNIASYDDWFDLVTRRLDYYEGMMAASRSSTPTERKTPSVAGDLAKHGSTPLLKEQRATVRAFIAKLQKRRGNKPNKQPPGPCWHCGQTGHWNADCPTKSAGTAGSSPAKAPLAPRRDAARRADGADDTTDGVVAIGPTAINFVIDTGATKSFVSAKHAARLARQEGVHAVPLSTPLTVDAAGSERMDCRWKVVTPATLMFNDGASADLHLIELYAVNGLRDDEVLLGRSTLRSLGLDIADMTKSALLAREHAGVADAATSAAEDADIAHVGAARRSAAAEKTEEAETAAPDEHHDRVPDVAAHDPADVAATLEEQLRRAQEQGLSAAAVDKLRAAVQGPLADAFRNVFSDDPPARVAPIRVETLPSIYELKAPPVRRYSKDGRLAMTALMKRLEKFKYVYKNNLATIVSPAYPVPKANVDPTLPPEERYRLTVDLRAVNAQTIPTKFPLPRLDTFAEQVAGHKFFGTLDLFGGYWQLPLHEDSQKFFSILTDAGIWTPLRLIQGSRNAAGPFQAIVAEVLGDAVGRICIQYVDDIMILGRTEEKFVDNWIEVIKRLHSVLLKISAKKTVFFAERVKYCGRYFSADGIDFDPSLVESVTKMPTPTTADELRRYLATTNWMRSSIPRYAEVVQPLQDVLTAALALAKTSGRKPNAIALADAGWTSQHDEVFTAVNAAVAKSTTLAYPDDDKVMCVFTDASDKHWAGVVTQVRRDQRDLPVLEQQHSPLGFISGTFSGASSRWPTIEKEAYAILETCIRMEHVLRRPDGFTIFTDHNNLRYLFSLNPAVFDGRRAAADRVERWNIILRGFDYDIRHIPGEENVLADLLTRWGATPRPACDAARAATTRARGQRPTPSASPTAAVSTRARGQRPTPSASPTTAVPTDASDAALATPPVRNGAGPNDAPALDASSPATAPAPRPPSPPPAPADTPAAARIPTPPLTPWQLYCRDMGLEFNVDDAPSLDDIRRAQHSLRPADIATHDLRPAAGLGDGLDGVLVDVAGKVFVPDVQHLRLRLCIVAHQGLGGHRGSDVATQWLTSRFSWPGIDSDIRTFCRACLHCLKAKGGKTVPRPWMHIPAATAPNEVLFFDYVYIRAADNDVSPVYVLVIVDGFSRFVWLSPHRQANAVNTATSLMAWFGLFGVARKWVSDQGRHFLNDVTEQLRARLGANHRFTTAYAPWSNGIVERVGRSLRETLSALLHELKRTPDTWPHLLPVVNCVINQSPSTALGGRAPLTAFTGRRPSSPLDVVFATSDGRVESYNVPLATADIASRLAALEDAFNEVITAVRDHTPRVHPTRPGEQPVDFGVGDYVLIAARRKAGGVKDKTAPLWTGPGLVVGALNDLSFVVHDLLSGKRTAIHAEHLKRYADSSLHVTRQLKSFIAASAVVCHVDAIVAHRKDNGAWQVRVLWEGFDDGDATWEDLLKLSDDVPELVHRYAKTIDDGDVRQELLAILALHHAAKVGRAA